MNAAPKFGQYSNTPANKTEQNFRERRAALLRSTYEGRSKSFANDPVRMYTDMNENSHASTSTIRMQTIRNYREIYLT